MALSRSSSKKWFDDDDFDFGGPEKVPKTSVKRPREEDFRVPAPKKPSLMLTNDALWIDRYKPTTTDQLAVQSKKVAEVRDWISSHLDRVGILLLMGPPGSGKTAIIDCLGRELSLEIQEWINPVVQVDYNQRGQDIVEEYYRFEDRADYVPQEKLFNDWARQSKYPQLVGGGRGKLVLIEDFPDFALRKTAEFEGFLQKYARNVQNPALVLIHSEGAKGQEALTRTVFKPDNLTKLGITTISLNAATNTNISKLLTKIVSEENKRGQSRLKLPDKQALEMLCESTGGDIRASINALQFSCLDSQHSLNNNIGSMFQSENSIPSSKKTSKKQAVKRPSKSQSSVGCKDQNLGLFHALGKVLYAKRGPEPETEPLPAHLEKHRRNNLQAVPEQVFEKACISEDGFCSFLHHNYPSFYTSVQDTDRLARYFSDCDLLLQEWGSTGKMDVKEYGLSVCARAVMFCNQNPAKVQGLRKMHKPELYAVKKKIDSNILSVENALGGLYISQSRIELFSSTIPLLAKLKPKCIPAHKLAGVLEIGRFPGLHPPATLPQANVQHGEDEDLWSEDDDQLFSQLEVCDGADNIKGPGTTAKCEDDDDDDLKIDDYDDDD